MQRLGPDRAVKNEWLWKGMELLGIEVLNIGGNDVEELGALGIELKRMGGLFPPTCFPSNPEIRCSIPT